MIANANRRGKKATQPRLAQSIVKIDILASIKFLVEESDPVEYGSVITNCHAVRSNKPFFGRIDMTIRMMTEPRRPSSGNGPLQVGSARNFQRLRPAQAIRLTPAERIGH